MSNETPICGRKLNIGTISPNNLLLNGLKKLQ